MALRTLLICTAAFSGTAVSQEPAPLVTQRYAVADVVLPIPEVVVVSLGGPAISARQSDLRTPDFGALIEEIETKIEPASWDAAGGPGVIATRASEMTLVVRQTEAVHDEIADLIRERRRRLDTQVAIEFRRVKVSEAFFEEVAKEVSQDGERRVYDETAATSLLKAMQSERSSSFDSAPKITLFDGQTIWLNQAADDNNTSVVLNAVIAKDRRSVRLSVAASGTKDGDAAILCENVNVPDRHTLLVNRGPVAEGMGCDLLLITPRVIVAEEEEERLSPSGEGPPSKSE